MMKLLPLLLTFFVVSNLFCSCATFSVGAGPSGTKADLYGVQVPVRDITFSVTLEDTVDLMYVYDEKIIKHIREDFAASGMFGKVHYVKQENASDYHYHFRITLTGGDAKTRDEYERLTFMTLGIIPSWYTIDADCSMSVLLRGKEVYCTTSSQSAFHVNWLPLVFISFLNEDRLYHGAIRYFLREVRANNLNSLK